jgi:microcompartment protein CcmL/EutN
MSDHALGFIETRGLIASIEAADAMLKAAQVTLVSKERADAGLMTIVVVGETAAVKSAVDAGAMAASKVGQLVSTHIIPRPDDQTVDVIFKDKIISKNKSKQSLVEFEPEKKETVQKTKTRSKTEKSKTESKPVVKPELSDETEDTTLNTIDRLRNEALGKKAVTIDSDAQSLSDLSMSDLEIQNVHQLRRLARSVQKFPIKGREISKANRNQLLDYFKDLLQ